MTSKRLVNRCRENPYSSAVMAAVAKPVYRFCAGLSAQLARKVRKNGVSVRLANGQNLRLARNSGVELASLLHWGGVDAYEPHTSRTLRFFFERVRNFVDVGANYGFYSLLAGLSNLRLNVIAFEPVPEICSALMRNVLANGLQRRIEIHQLALSSCTGTGRFFLPQSEATDRESTGSLAPDSWQQRKKSPSFPVTTIRFDDFERQHPMTLELVKVDVEDFEADVLLGMEATITRDRPFIVCEILPRAHANERTRKWVESMGYTPYWITPCGYTRVSRFDFSRPAYQDFLLSPVRLPGEVLTDLEGLWAEAINARHSLFATR